MEVDRMERTCERYQAALSARADGEATGVPDGELDRHVAGCADCGRFARVVGSVGRRGRVGPAPTMPDLSGEVTRRVALADRLASIGVARGLLAVIAVQVVVLSVPDLLAVDTELGPAHAARHLGAFSIAYAGALLLVVVRPARARTIFYVGCVLGVALVLTAVVDVAQGRVPLIGEATHLPELLSVWLLWLLARTRPDSEPAAASGPATLRAVRERADGDA